MTDTDITPAHAQEFVHRYVVHYPSHEPRQDDPNYADFSEYHKKNRPTARCYVGSIIGFDQCADEKGNPVSVDSDGYQSGLELHHAHIEFALQNSIDLSVLESVYPGVSDASSVGAWVESGANFMWLCTFHHRGAGGAHTATASDWEAEKFVKGLITKAD